jgi:23S rRNA pseudouridine2605 synthase
MQERLQKLIAQAGIASRRAAEELIVNGRVTVNGERAILGTKADPEVDHIKVNGKLINIKIEKHEPTYILLNKPKGVLSSVADEKKRKLVTDFIPKKFGKLHPVGRLDYQTEGLILLTNVGEFTNTVLASKTIPKIYEVKTKGILPEVSLNKLRRGTVLEDGFKTSPCEIKVLESTKTNGWYLITLFEGHNLQIRKMFDLVAHSVVKLRRISIGNLTDEGMPIGSFRVLLEKDVKDFLRRRTPKQEEAIAAKSASAKNKPAKHSRSIAPRKPKRGVAKQAKT